MYSRKEACPFLWRIVPLPPEMNSRCVPPSARLKTMSAMRRSTTFLEHLIHLKIATSRCLTNDTTAATLHFIPFYTYLCVKGVGNDAIGWPDRSQPVFLLGSGVARASMLYRLHALLRQQDASFASDPSRYVMVMDAPYLPFVHGWGRELAKWPEISRLRVWTTHALADGNTSARKLRRLGAGVSSVPYVSPVVVRQHRGKTARLPEIALRPRGTLVAAAFGAIDAGLPGSALRPALRASCAAAGASRCALVSSFGATRNKAGRAARGTDVHVAKGGSAAADAALDAYSSAQFSLQPPGDTITRKGIIDSLAAGCVPVIFDPLSVTQWSNHFPSATAYSVLLSPAVTSVDNVTARLQAMVDSGEASHSRGRISAWTPRPRPQLEPHTRT